MAIQAKQFATRSELDSHIVSTYGTDIQGNRKDETLHIEGTDADLRRLNLSTKSNVYGVAVKSTSKQSNTKEIINTAEMRKGKKKKVLYGTSTNRKDGLRSS